MAGGATWEAPWFSVTLGKEDIPWAYTRGLPFRSISALELLATLFGVILFIERFGMRQCGGTLSITAFTDSKVNAHVMDGLLTTKFPAFLVLIELADKLE
eukprot:6248563-Amphidinium_carterae.1